MAFVTATLLAFIRLGALFLMTPLFATTQVPVNIRVLLLLALSAVFVASLHIRPTQVPHTLGDLFLASSYELFVGALMAFGLYAAFGAFLFGGRILDFQMGFGVANLINPSTNTQGPLLGNILNLMAVVTFFLLDGHHVVMRGIAYSFQQIPIGQGLVHFDIEHVVYQFGRMFVFGLMLVAPAVFILLLLDAGMAVAARTMPQVNIFIVGLPLKTFVGLVVLAASLKYMSPLVSKIFESIFRYWERALA
ncbi:flagellar biosynthetic protein FliR [Marinobacterium ramblicola]|uniref:flagellar biosynthetic protein FliR n=1 Tax=Marinobacterium ramblicola TaxID=2849041 RepID=UPI001C2D2DB3|nr:flagellar biosynthetic protein FliR [Marinobacterium ramblicola]